MRVHGLSIVICWLVFLMTGCSKQEVLPELPPLEKPLQPPAPLVEVIPSIKDVSILVENTSGETITEAADTAGCIVRVSFTYEGGAGPPNNEWSPNQKSVKIRLQKRGKRSGALVTSTAVAGRIQKVDKNRYEMSVSIEQSIKPNDYLVEAKLSKFRGFAGGRLATTSLKVTEQK